MELSAYGGVGEIGGNKLLLSAGKEKLWIDMGFSFHSQSEFYNEFLQPRPKAGLLDLFEFGMAPKVRGLYSREALAYTNMEYEEPSAANLLVSHPHWDHVGMLRYIDPSIKVHLGVAAKVIMDAWAATSPFAKFGAHDYNTFRSGAVLKMDSITARPIHVDHSVPGAYGYLIETPSGTVAYTGDFRQHGPGASMTEDFIRYLEKVQPDVLIAEGTRIGPGKRASLSEADVHNEIVRLVKSAPDKLVVENHPPRDVDRIRTMIAAAANSGRTYAMSAKSAYLLNAMKALDNGIKLPDLWKNDVVKVYERSFTRGLSWEDKMLGVLENAGKTVGAKEIRENPEKYLLHLEHWHMNELNDIHPSPGTPFIHARIACFDEESYEEARIRENWLRHYGMPEYQVHASGHLSESELQMLIQRTRPKVVVPIHTQGASEYARLAPQSRVVQPVLNGVVELG